MFVDEVEVDLRAGNGGDGCMSFRRAKYEPHGGPNGGDGGNGGNVIIVADNNVSDLTAYRFMPHWSAQNGEPGRGSDQYGAKGKDRILKVPCGTLIIDTETDELAAELVENGAEVMLLKGGKGGLGNIHFKSSTNQAPREYTPGEVGESGRYRMVVKTIAHVGLVGFPNAGKSTLIGMLTNAKPKTAAYPFTTLNPHVGVMEDPETYRRLTLADIPGLIEGASENRGLGHRFLRHIERCHLILYVIDMAGTDNREPADDLDVLRRELAAYSADLAEKPFLIAVNKMDEPAAAEHLAAFRQRHPFPVIPVSCLTDEGLAQLKEALFNRLDAESRPRGQTV